MFVIENQYRKTDQYPARVCLDGGGEFVNSKLQTFYRSWQINQIVSEPYHSQHNGRVERVNRTIIKSARAIISNSGLPKSCWHEVVRSSSVMLNQIPKEKGGVLPWKMMHNNNLPLGYLQPIGTAVTY